MALDYVSLDSAQTTRAPVKSPTQAYNRREILQEWALAAVPLALLTNLVAPWLVERVPLPAVLIYWLLLLLGMVWLTGVSFWALHREGVPMRFVELRRRLWINPPLDPRTNQPRPRFYIRLLPRLLALLLINGTALILLPNLMRFAAALLNQREFPTFLKFPAFTYATELVSPEFAGGWWLLLLVLITWLLTALLGEELLFRGVLLPKMGLSFGKWDWAANALLFSLYYLFQPALIPFRLLAAPLIAHPVRHYRSFWMGFALRTSEAVALLILVMLGIRAPTLSPLSAELNFPLIAVHPQVMRLAHPTYQGSIPHYDPALMKGTQVDLRSQNLTSFDLRNNELDLQHSSFDTSTRWPAAGSLPPGFDPVKVLESGKDPGLGVRSLHAQGITGKGVGIAIIDQHLLVDHNEYADRLRWYEEIDRPFFTPSTATLHGAAVASIAVGKTVGMAPDADLYFIGIGQSPYLYNHYIAQGIRRILELNQALPAGHKIHSISISAGWNSALSGNWDVVNAVKEARAQGLLIVYSNMGDEYGVGIIGLDHNPLGNPNDFTDALPGVAWSDFFFSGRDYSNHLWIPCDSRTVASPTGINNYEWNRSGGLSWSIPYLAGMYALALQIDPSLTPEGFLSRAKETGYLLPLEKDGKTFLLGPILNPVKIISSLRNN